jgi:hypothetical protein
MKHPPYQLRTNKAVDRLLLANILLELGGKCKNYRYYSLAGPFLEDLRVMDHFLPDMKLVSLENDFQTYKRQDFHKFNSIIVLLKKNLMDFMVNDYEPEENTKDVFWLDYTDLKYARFQEFQLVLKRVPPGSIVRITLRAQRELNVDDLEDYLPSDILEGLKSEMEKRFTAEFDKVLPPDAPGAFAAPKEFARMVQYMVRYTASEALDIPGSQVDFLPVQSTRYNDNTEMISITGVVCSRDQIALIKKELESITYANFDWHEPDLINIPALSMKERLWLEKHLPVEAGKDAGEELYALLGYMIDSSEKTSKQQLAHYADYCRFYPNFVRINL